MSNVERRMANVVDAGKPCESSALHLLFTFTLRHPTFPIPSAALAKRLTLFNNRAEGVAMPADLKFPYIALEGPIGVGKTTLAKVLAKKLGSTLLLEDLQNPFLPEFYGGRKGASFQCQLFFLLTRYQQQQQLVQRSLFDTRVVADYIPKKDKIFAHLNLNDSE